MKRNYLKIAYILVAVAAVNLLVTLCLIPVLPQEVPVHANVRFEVDRMGSRWFVALIPAITAAFSITMAVEQKIRGRDYANNRPLTFFAVAFEAFFIALGWALYAMSATGAQLGDVRSVPIDLIMGLGMSVLFVVLGNYLPTVKPNRTFGIRVRATLESEEVWKKTHRFAGHAYVLGGFFAAACALIGHFADLNWLTFGGLMLGVFASSAVILIYARRIEKQLKA